MESAYNYTKLKARGEDMKEIAVVATEKEYAEFLMNNISKYLGRYARFRSYSIAEVERLESATEDFVLVSAFNIFQQVRQKISARSEIVVLSLSLTKKQMDKLKRIPKGTKALLVNFDHRTCMHTITSMYASGFRDVELFPYYGEGDYDHSIEVAVTPNERHLVPPGIKHVIDVGESSVDMNSLYIIAEKLGVYDEFVAGEAAAARKEYYYINSSMDKLLNDKESMSDKLNVLMNLMNEGIIIIDVVGRIYLCNEKARQLMSHRSQVLLGFNIEELLPELDVKSSRETLIKSATINLIASAVEIRSGEKIAGHIITLKDFEETESRQHDMRSTLYGAGHAAGYTFEDILGTSRAIRECIEVARRVARSDAAVMITGESGTGKEMFAQGIHNESARKSYNFVAVNCAAIPDSLLESEMFGYEEGSFTGAKKGGKVGYFELAHKGTIFLDEIGEMPMTLQSKLLRVLEERKIVRIGSSRSIDVDVRVIAASNKDLFAMVEERAFREDLFYRLNVLPLNIPSLRSRTEDILPIFYYFAKRGNSDMVLSPGAAQALTHYSWRGNVRELRNVVEFLLIKEKQVIEIEDLPPLRGRMTARTRDGDAAGMGAGEAIRKAAAHIPAGRIGTCQGTSERFILNEWKEIGLYRAVLTELMVSYERSERYGRQELAERINAGGGFYTEGEVRKALSRLSANGFVRSARGRGGSVITPEGMMLLRTMERFGEVGE